MSCPAPENCETVSAVVPNVASPLCVNTYPFSAATVPCSTKTKVQPESSAPVFASVALVRTRVALPVPKVDT